MKTKKKCAHPYLTTMCYGNGVGHVSENTSHGHSPTPSTHREHSKSSKEFNTDASMNTVSKKTISRPKTNMQTKCDSPVCKNEMVSVKKPEMYVYTKLEVPEVEGRKGRRSVYKMTQS